MTTVVEHEGAEADVTETQDRSGPGRFPIVLAVVALALALLAGWQGLRIQEQRDDDDREASAVRVASSQALTLLGISQSNVDDRLEELLDHSTGDFKRELAGAEESIGALIKKGGVASSGKVVSAALVNATDKDARVLLALSSEVTNKQAKEPEPRAYRITVDLAWEEDQWLVSGMQFAP